MSPHHVLPGGQGCSELYEIDVLDESILRMEQEIQLMNRKLTELKRQRNTRVPVARLPLEVLSEIFMCHQQAHKSTWRHLVKSIGSSWIFVSHVCHHWRQTALSTPRLWVRVDLCRSQVARELMRRACSLPMEPYLITKGHDILSITKLMRLFPDHPGKIRSITLHHNNNMLTTFLSTLAPSLTQNLRALEIGCFMDDADRSIHSHVSNISIPRLEELRLQSCKFDWDCVLLTSCRASLLRLVLLWSGSNQYHKFFDVLGSMHRLKSLTLMYALRGVPKLEVPPEDTPVAEITSLRHLYIMNHWHCSRLLYTHLRVPNKCWSKVHVRRNLKDMLPLFAISELIKPIASVKPDTLRIKVTSTYVNILTLSTEGASRTMSMPHEGCDSCLTHFRVIGDELSQHAQVLRLNISAPLASAALRALSGGMMAVATVLSLEGTPDALAAIAECLADPEGFLPRLAVVVFEDFDMGTVEGEVLAKWVHALQKREAGGIRTEIEFDDCRGVSEELIASLSEYMYKLKEG